jgi:glucose/arabinose dehydrogenase
MLLLLTACDGAAEEEPTLAPEADLPTEAAEPTEAVEATEPLEEPTEEAEPTEAAEPTEPVEEATEPAEEPTEEVAEPEETATGEGTAVPGEEGAAEVGLELVVDGLAAPLVFTPVPDDSGRFLIVDQVGLIYVLDADGQLLETPFLDVSDRMVDLDEGYDERGLLGLALHPDYAENGRFFVYYSAPLRDGAPADWDHTSHVSEFQVSADDPNLADPDSEQILMQIDQPQVNHDGGQITFGPDGYLYIPLGDGGGADDVGLGHVEDWYEFNEGGNGQDMTENLLGSILRIDVDNEGENGEPYAIPEDNPFVGEEGVPAEQWATGFRNPFRISFDMGGDNELFVGDAGQNRWEEVSIVSSGGNYGWNVKEGTHCFSTANPDQDAEECPSETPDGAPLIDPVIEYQNGNQPDGLGLVVIGGYVYRGSALPQFEGDYVFGDWSTSFGDPLGKLLVATPAETEGELWPWEQITIANREDGQVGEFVLSFGQDADGELYVLTTETPGPTGDTGKVYRLVPAGEGD